MKAQLFLTISACLMLGCISKNTSESAVHKATAPLHGETSTNQFIYVGGEVKMPGRFAWTNGMTLEDAIAAAGGFTDYAPDRLYITHPDGTREKLKVNPKKRFRKNPLIMSGDKIHSPRIFL